MAWNDLTNPEAWKLALANLLRKGEDVGTYISEAPEKAGKAIVEAGQRQSALMNKAFDPTGKTLIRNPQAANQAAMNLLEGPLSIAPAGITKLVGSQAKSLEIAQKNAALPISEGGLGLPPNNTAMDRAKAMGYEDWFHGTERLDRLLEKKALNPKRATSGPMPYGTASEQMASSYATGKKDTSRIANDIGDLSQYFQVSPKDLGFTRSRSPYTVEQTWYHLSPEKQAEILDKAKRIGYENIDEASGKFVVHPTSDGAPFSQSHFDYTLKREAGGNPLKALRQLYAESGMLDAYAPRELADIYKLAGYPHSISQSNAPWSSSEGVLVGKSRITNPIVTNNVEEIQTKIIPALEEAFKNDKTKLKPGPDQWGKNSRYTPKEWVETLKKDLIENVGTPIPEQSYVWTSIPDKVTEQLKKLGYNGIIDTGGKGGGQGHQVIIPFEPNQIRSKFAAFDPKNINKADLLAGAVPLGIVTNEDTRKAVLEKLFDEKDKKSK